MTAAVISCWHDRDNLPEKKIKQNFSGWHRKQKFNAYQPLKLKGKKVEVNKKKIANLPTLFQNMG